MTFLRIILLIAIVCCTNSIKLKGFSLHGRNVSSIGRNVPIVLSQNCPDSSSQNTNQINLARLNLIGCSVVYGSNYVVTKALLKTIPSDLLNVFRFIIPFLAFLPTIVSLKERRRTILVGIELGLFCAIGFIAQSIALQRASSNKVAFFISLGVLMPPLFDSIASMSKYWLPKEESVKLRKPVLRPNSSVVSRILNSPFIPPLLAVIGASILEFANGADPARIEDVLLLLTPLSFAFCFYRSGQHAAVTASLPYADEVKLMHTKSITAVMMLTTSILSSVYATYTGQFPLSGAGWVALYQQITSSWKTVVLLLYTGVVCTGWTAISEQKALRVLSSGDIAMIYTLEPIFASFFGVILLSEVITPNICMGAAFILAACVYPTLLEKIESRQTNTKK